MIALKVRRIGDELSIAITPEAAALLGLREGDALYAEPTAGGIAVSREDVETARQVAAAEEVMRRNDEALRRLAQ